MMTNDYFLATDTGNSHLLCILGWDSEQRQKLLEDFGTGAGLVLLDDVAHLVEHDQLEAALHLRDRQLLVHAVAPRQQQLLGHLDAVEEAAGQPPEPLLPELLGRQEVGPPDVLNHLATGFINLGNHLRRHRHSGTF
jgi:hypothetical protein